MKKGIIVGIVAVVVVAGIAAAMVMNKQDATAPTTSTSTSSNSSAADKSSASATPEATNKVSIENFAFAPGDITVKKGTTVTWTNNDSAAHTVTIDSGGGPESGTLNKGDTYSFTFDSAGTYAYHCAMHPSMTATVTVTE